MDATEAFESVGHSEQAVEMQKKFLIGKYVPKNVNTESAESNVLAGNKKILLCATLLTAIAVLVYFFRKSK